MSLLIQEIISDPPRPIIFVYPDVFLPQCIKLMCDEKIGALVVMDEQNLMGIISERDIIQAINSNQSRRHEIKASEVLFSDIAVMKPSDSIESAMLVMNETRRRHILVGNEGSLVSVISIGDILLSLLNRKSNEADQLTKYITS